MSDEPLSTEPYGIMLRRDDPDFKRVVDAAMLALFKSGAVKALYETWFLKPIPPKGITLGIPISPAFQKVLDTPTDSGNPDDYKQGRGRGAERWGFARRGRQQNCVPRLARRNGGTAIANAIDGMKRCRAACRFRRST